MANNRPFLNTRQASFYLGISITTLQRLRRCGQGPIFRQHSRFILYHVDDLNTWSLANSSAPSPVGEIGNG